MSHPLLDNYKADLRAMIADQGQAVILDGAGIHAMIVGERRVKPDFVPEEYGYQQARWIHGLVHTDDVPAEPVDGDALVVDSVTYRVRFAEPVMHGAGWRIAATREIRI
jgi:hypothetical protein